MHEAGVVGAVRKHIAAPVKAEAKWGDGDPKETQGSGPGSYNAPGIHFHRVQRRGCIAAVESGPQGGQGRVA